MRVHVTQEHINNGARCLARRCPVALALKEACVEPAISLVAIQIQDKTIRMPNKMIDWVEDFDNTLSMPPFDFDIDLDKGEITSCSLV